MVGILRFASAFQVTGKHAVCFQVPEVKRILKKNAEDRCGGAIRIGKEVRDMGSMKEIASTFARVEQLATRLIHISGQQHRGACDCGQILDEVAELAWKLVDAVTPNDPLRDEDIPF